MYIVTATLPEANGGWQGDHEVETLRAARTKAKDLRTKHDGNVLEKWEAKNGKWSKS